MKNIDKLLLLAILFGQLCVAEELGKNSVGRPKMFGPENFKVPGKVGRPKNVKVEPHPLVAKNPVGRPPKLGPKYDMRLVPYQQSANALTVVEKVKPVSPLSMPLSVGKKLGAGLRYARVGVVGTALGYVGEKLIGYFVDTAETKIEDVDIFEDDVQSVSRKKELVDDSFKNVILSGPTLSNLSIFQYGAGALCITGLGYAAYKIGKKVYENYFEKNRIKNDKTV